MNFAFILDASGTSSQLIWTAVAENVWQPDLEPQSEFFALGFSTRTELVREPFKGLPLVQLEFTVEMPWVINAEETV